MPPVTLCTLEKSLTEVKKFAIMALRSAATSTQMTCRIGYQHQDQCRLQNLVTAFR